MLPDRPGDQLDIMHATRECIAFDDPFVLSRIAQKLLFVVPQPFAASRLDFGLMDFCA
jgi:hypothetical protein